MVTIRGETGKVDREDAELLIDRMRTDSKKASRTENSVQSSNSSMSKQPRWGPMTFDEHLKNDMFVNRVKDVSNANRVSKNFVKHNIQLLNKAVKKEKMKNEIS